MGNQPKESKESVEYLTARIEEAKKILEFRRNRLKRFLAGE